MDRQIAPSLAETVASQSLAPVKAAEAPRVTSSFEEEGRFVPGTLVGGRYRIIALLGRGGMGEVYRATDLTLGQSVALKFLPEEAAKNQRLLERFHGEVRVARLVSHPNVCRVYDIGEVEGTPFISMEYVDGEDLASLLTRIGRLPSDKAIETARKLCAGLAAAHDRGVIHRDLKPQNIMMNKRGEVVIMDFGLAAIADHLAGAEARNGTPAYMSPEQLRGETVSAKSDIYALGLVLYELFTGKRPYDAASVQQLIDMQQSMHLTSVVSVASDVDPAVEKVIRRCLDPDPMRRPASPVAVAAALPGGDPLAAALAAGETPSPELVAAAGTVEGMARKYTIPLLIFIAACLIAVVPLREARTAMVRAPMDRSPEVLAHESRTFAAQFGYTNRPADSAVWLEHRGELIGYLQKLPMPHLWREWYAAESPVRSVYRESPRPLVAAPYGDVGVRNPPPLLPGMVEVTLDGNGRLLDLEAVPDTSAPPFTQPVAPEAVFRAAGLDPAAFREIDPPGVPTYPFDARRAWKGPHPKLPNTELRLDVAWWKGRITRARLFYPWSADSVEEPAAATTSGARLRGAAIWVLEGIGAFFVILLARHNWKNSRADRQGARRIAIARFLLAGVTWIGWTHPIGTEAFLEQFLAASGDWLLSAAILWTVYLALEPAVRSRWPHSIVTWNRVLAGRWLDAQVGSDILVGAAVGSAMWVAFKLLNFAMNAHIEPVSQDASLYVALGTRQWIGAYAGILGAALRLGIIVFLAVFGLRRMLQYDWLAVPAVALLFTMTEGEPWGSDNWLILTLIYVAVYSILILVLLRWGLISTIMAVFIVNCFNGIVLGGDWKTWYTPYSIASLLLVIGIAIFAFWRSLGGRDLIGDEGAA
jgi:predicted Ser/Thr protein kinase